MTGSIRLPPRYWRRLRKPGVGWLKKQIDKIMPLWPHNCYACARAFAPIIATIHRLTTGES